MPVVLQPWADFRLPEDSWRVRLLTWDRGDMGGDVLDQVEFLAPPPDEPWSDVLDRLPRLRWLQLLTDAPLAAFVPPHVSVHGVMPQRTSSNGLATLAPRDLLLHQLARIARGQQPAFHLSGGEPRTD